MKNINTTVYRLACAGFAEKDGLYKLRALVTVEVCGCSPRQALQKLIRRLCADISKVA